MIIWICISEIRYTNNFPVFNGFSVTYLTYFFLSWSLDDAVYEATILSTVDDDKVTVRFIGYDNEDTVYIEDLLESKGQEWRDLQIEVNYMFYEKVSYKWDYLD